MPNKEGGEESGEYKRARERGDFLLIEVRADQEARWERMNQRGRSGDPLDKEVFLKQEEAEASSNDEAGQALDATAEMADITIDNDGTLEELERKLEEVWSNLSRAQ